MDISKQFVGTQRQYTRATVDSHPAETAQERVARLYRSPGGPLMGWLLDEAHSRNMSQNDMALSLGVTVGYVNQLRTGVRKTENVGQEFAEAASRYLGVPTIVVKLLAGHIKVSDFARKHESQEQVVERALRQVQKDLQTRMSTTVDLSSLPFEAKQAIVLLHSEVSGYDYLNTQELPHIVYSLTKAMMVHCEESLEAVEDEYPDSDARH
jgi:transcriptional regulator with XRE-family HTH domain